MTPPPAGWCSPGKLPGSAEREAGEELGIYNTELKQRFEFYYEDPSNRIWGAVFTCRYDGEFIHQPEEVESGFFVSVDDVLAQIHQPVTPDTMEALRQLLSKFIPGELVSG